MSFSICGQQLEELRARYRELRDTGRFTPTRTSPAHSAAVSVSGDDVQRDVTGKNSGLGSGEGGAESLNAEQHVHNASVPMDECPPPAPAAPGGAPKRRCVEATACAPSVEAVSSGRWHYTADHCRSLISVLNERLAEHQGTAACNLVRKIWGNGCYGQRGIAVGMLSARSGTCTSSLKSHSGEFSKSVCFFSHPPPLSGFKRSHSGEFSKSVCFFSPAAAFVWFQAVALWWVFKKCLFFFFPSRRLCLVSSSRTLVSFQKVFVFFFPTRRLCLVSSSRTLVGFQKVFVFFSPAAAFVWFQAVALW